MTDLQDLILDRLVGAPVGANWPDGPLAIAAAVVGGAKPVKFGQTDNDRGAKAEIARRLGYPVLLCEAVQGGNRGLPAENDRRGFAMTVFRTIPVGGPLPRLSAEAQNRVAAALAARVHPLFCPDPGCPVLTLMAHLAADGAVVPAASGGLRCGWAAAPVRDGYNSWLTARSTHQQRLIQTAGQVVNGLVHGRSMGGWCSIRESVRLAAAERGAAEAVAFCADIARRCGMAV